MAHGACISPDAARERNAYPFYVGPQRLESTAVVRRIAPGMAAEWKLKGGDEED